MQSNKWSFSGNLASNFEDHIKRSIPFYEEGHELILNLADFFLRENSLCFDLGVSNGTLITKLANKFSNNQFIGLDKEPDMLKIAAEKTQNHANVKLEVADITEYKYPKCDLIISYYTVQFLKPILRQSFIKQIFKILNPGGALILFEKVYSETPKLQEYFSVLLDEFKLAQGFSGNEIIAKSQSLKGILEPNTTAQNLTLLKKAGFKDAGLIFKYLSFEGYLAIK